MSCMVGAIGNVWRPDLSNRSPFLALDIQGRVDRDGHLLSADPHLLRLHLANGGVDGGVLSVPPLLALCMLVWRTGAKIERSVTVAEGANDVELWVSVARATDWVNLSISGWQDAAAAHRRFERPILDPALADRRPSQRVDLRLDQRGILVQIDAGALRFVKAGWIGRTLNDIFLFEGEAPDLPGGLDAERIFQAHLRNDTRRFALSITPLRSEAGDLVGFDCQLAGDADDRAETVADRTPAPERFGFGRHFASAVRRPLGRIIANAETIGAHVNGPIKENYTGYALDIAAAARHLSDLVSDLEDLEAIDREDFKVAAERVELGDICRRVAGLLALKAADHQISLELPSAELTVEVLAEFRRVLQIALNLVGNAIRYAPGGSTVRIEISATPPTLSVSDQGSGVAEEDRDRVFEKFERLGRSGDGGSGLGLYISRRLARAMKGDLTVGESQEGGAKFTLSLPAFKGD